MILNISIYGKTCIQTVSICQPHWTLTKADSIGQEKKLLKKNAPNQTMAVFIGLRNQTI